MKASEVARLVGLSRWQIARLAHEIPGFRKTRGGHIRFRDGPKLRHWIANRKQRPLKSGQNIQGALSRMWIGTISHAQELSQTIPKAPPDWDEEEWRDSYRRGLKSELKEQADFLGMLRIHVMDFISQAMNTRLAADAVVLALPKSKSPLTWPQLAKKHGVSVRTVAKYVAKARKVIESV